MMQLHRVDGEIPVGSRVVDVHNVDDIEDVSTVTACRPMRVIEEDYGAADEVEVKGTPVVEIEPNNQYPADDQVVKVVYESNLNARVPGWTDNVDTLDEYLSWFASEWSVTVQQYYYPISRLRVPVETNN